MELLTTPRLALGPFRIGDGPGLKCYVSKPEVTLYDSPYPDDDAGCAAVAKFFAESDEFWAVRLRDSGGLIGHIHWGIRPDEPGCVRNLGFILDSAFWGQGLACEACTAVIRHGFATGTEAFLTGTRLENGRSVRLLARLGFARVETGDPTEGVFRLQR